MREHVKAVHLITVLLLELLLGLPWYGVSFVLWQDMHCSVVIMLTHDHTVALYIYIYICSLFNDTVCKLEYMSLNNRMIIELRSMYQ
jgi:hypothetical protein